MTGIPFSEGPVWCPDGTVVATSVAAGGRCTACGPSRPRSSDRGDRGGANGAALAADGSILVTQNGGMDFSKLPGVFATFLPACVPVTPGLQLVAPGRHGDDPRRVLHRHRRYSGPERSRGHARRRGVLHRSRPLSRPRGRPRPRAWSTSATDRCARSPTASHYCNGIAFEPDGTVVVVERRGLQRVFPDGEREWVVEARPGRRRRLLPRRRRPLLRRVDDRARRAGRRPRRHDPRLPAHRRQGRHDELLLRRRRPAHAVRHRRAARQPRGVRGHADAGVAATRLARTRRSARRPRSRAHCSGSSSASRCTGRSKYSTLSLPAVVEPLQPGGTPRRSRRHRSGRRRATASCPARPGAAARGRRASRSSHGSPPQSAT